jgi:hypothetical protein
MTVSDMTCQLSNLEPDQQYVARVAARFEDHFSEYSNECIFTTLRIGIEVYTLEGRVSVYPNPAHHYVDINAEEGITIRSYRLYSTDGKLLHSASVEDAPVRVPVANLTDGIYFLEIVCDEGMVTKKIVKR